MRADARSGRAVGQDHVVAVGVGKEAADAPAVHAQPVELSQNPDYELRGAGDTATGRGHRDRGDAVAACPDRVAATDRDHPGMVTGEGEAHPGGEWLALAGLDEPVERLVVHRER